MDDYGLEKIEDHKKIDNLKLWTHQARSVTKIHANRSKTVAR